jgi:hypothetical protein
MDKWDKIDKNIVIHGAGLAKPSSSNEFGSGHHTSNNPSSAGGQSNSNNPHSGSNHARSNIMSSMDSDTNLEDFSEYRGGSINERGNVFDAMSGGGGNHHAGTDTEINLISASGSGGGAGGSNHNSKMYHYSTFNYYNNHTLYHHGLGGGPGFGTLNSNSNNHQSLPRIENSFPSKGLNSSKVDFFFFSFYFSNSRDKIAVEVLRNE